MVIAKIEPCEYEITMNWYNKQTSTIEEMGPLCTRHNNTNTRYKKKTE